MEKASRIAKEDNPYEYHSSTLKIPQFCSTVFAIHPLYFGFNAETAKDNHMQHDISLSGMEIRLRALELHDKSVQNMREAGIEVLLYHHPSHDSPDSTFPDWFTLQRGNNLQEPVLSIFPMKCENRRTERDPSIIRDMRKIAKHVIDITYLEKEGHYLEAKGSVIYDHRNCKIYCTTSERASPVALAKYVSELNKYSVRPWNVVSFKARDKTGKLIYHTDCMLTLLDKHALIVADALEESERKKIIEELSSPAKNPNGPYSVLYLTFEEMGKMCSNVLNVISDKGENTILMSKSAYEGYQKETREILQKYYRLVISDIGMIEEISGGSQRCLLAEIFK